MTTTVRPQLMTWTQWVVDHAAQIHYEEVRPFPLGTKLPMICDCAATFTNIYYLAGAPDPNGPAFHYDAYGNTVTLAQNGQMISLAQVQPGDAVLYYNGYGWSPSDTVHVAIVTDVSGDYAADPMTMSHGADPPAYVRVSFDGRPHQYFRFAVNSRFPSPKPVKVMPPAKGNPTAAQLKVANMVRLKTPLGARQALHNGWHLWYWSETRFVAQVGGKQDKTTLYANRNWRRKT